ncbi:MAG: hypothetical protein IH937_09035 [Acidobacteria bacterium]|nr:hypothetical protein [Acidobacteriota bacterium]
MKKFIFLTVMVLVLAGSTSFGVAADTDSWTGWISDARCAADYQKSATADHVGCAKICIKNGGQWALSMPDGALILEIDAAEAEQHLGHEVVIKGELDTASNTVTVSSVSLSN